MSQNENENVTNVARLLGDSRNRNAWEYKVRARDTTGDARKHRDREALLCGEKERERKRVIENFAVS